MGRKEKGLRREEEVQESKEGAKGVGGRAQEEKKEDIIGKEEGLLGKEEGLRRQKKG